MTDDQQPAVIVKDLYKSFKLPHEQHSGIKQVIVNFAKRKKGYEVQHVLEDISFEIKKGEFFGIVGRNGSGKSTLLKLLAGIYAPDKGLVQINGSLTPFIELGVGFNPELTGRENVFLNGALLGFDRKDMEDMYDDIVEFAELERFMDQKLKNYSSGMQVRLAFSIAIRAQSDILLLDEVLAVGDEAFQRKCFEYFSQLKIAKKTVILVTHSMDSVRKFCDRALLLHDGNIENIGNIQEITKLYEEANLPGKNSSSTAKRSESKENSNKTIHVKAEALDRDGDITSNFMATDKVRLKVEIISQEPLKDVFLGISFHKPSGEAVFVKTTEKQGETISSLEPNVPVYVDIKIQNIFAEDTYFVNVSIKSNDRTKVYLVEEDIERFNVISTGLHKTSLRPDYTIKVETKG